MPMALWEKLGWLGTKLISAATGETSPGQSADSLAEEQDRPVPIKGPGAAAPLTVDKAKELIFDRLCKEYKARGAGAGLESEALRKELGIPEDIFRWALGGMTSGATASGLYVDRDYTGKRIFLGMRGQFRCQDGVNPFAAGQPVKK